MLTLNELLETVKLCENDLTKFNIKIPNATYEVSKRMTSSLGICYFEGRKITIRISHLVSDKSLLRSVVMHEMLHASLGPGYGHGVEWLELANRITNAMPETYIIQKYTDREQHQKMQEALEIKIKKDGGGIVTCSGCNLRQVVTKRHGVYKNPSVYRCKCGGKLTLERY